MFNISLYQKYKSIESSVKEAWIQEMKETIYVDIRM